MLNQDDPKLEINVIFVQNRYLIKYEQLNTVFSLICNQQNSYTNIKVKRYQSLFESDFLREKWFRKVNQN